MVGRGEPDRLPAVAQSVHEQVGHDAIEGFRICIGAKSWVDPDLDLVAPAGRDCAHELARPLEDRELYRAYANRSRFEPRKIEQLVDQANKTSAFVVRNSRQTTTLIRRQDVASLVECRHDSAKRGGRVAKLVRSKRDELALPLVALGELVVCSRLLEERADHGAYNGQDGALRLVERNGRVALGKEKPDVLAGAHERHDGEAGRRRFFGQAGRGGQARWLTVDAAVAGKDLGGAAPAGGASNPGALEA